MEKISVCVPSYNRPKMIEQIILSFINQDYLNKELIISDDSSNEEVELMCYKYKKYCNIRYHKNKKNLWYSKNFLHSIILSEADYILILWDDDFLLEKYTLSKYVKIFNENQNINYIYSNQIQFDNTLEVSYLSEERENRYYRAGKDAIQWIWTTSIFIPWIWLRNNLDFSQLYPEQDLLFPQLEMVGNILCQYDGYFIGDYLIAWRSHNDQLWFHAIKKQRIKWWERHWTIELFDIFNDLKRKYKLWFTNLFLIEDLLKRYRTMILKEKTIVWNYWIKENYKNFIEMDEKVKNDKILKFSYNLAKILPKSIINIIRYIYII